MNRLFNVIRNNKLLLFTTGFSASISYDLYVKLKRIDKKPNINYYKFDNLIDLYFDDKFIITTSKFVDQLKNYNEKYMSNHLTRYLINELNLNLVYVDKNNLISDEVTFLGPFFKLEYKTIFTKSDLTNYKILKVNANLNKYTNLSLECSSTDTIDNAKKLLNNFMANFYVISLGKYSDIPHQFHQLTDLKLDLNKFNKSTECYLYFDEDNKKFIIIDIDDIKQIINNFINKYQLSYDFDISFSTDIENNYNKTMYLNHVFSND